MFYYGNVGEKTEAWLLVQHVHRPVASDPGAVTNAKS